MLDLFNSLKQEPQLMASLWMTLFAVWSASVLGSVHCLGMCGPIAFGVSRSWQQSLAYNVGRGITYVLLGLFCGWVGDSLLNINILGLRYFLTALMVGLILFISWRVAVGRPLEASLPSSWLRSQHYVFKKIMGLKLFGDASKSFLVGLFTIALPCGWLYTFAVLAATSGSAERGALIMGSFWFGTLPIMSLAPTLTQKVLVPLQMKSPKLAGLVIASTSLFVIWMKWSSLTSETHSCH